VTVFTNLVRDIQFGPADDITEAPRIENAKVATTSGPVPGFQPSADAFAAADELVALLRSALRHAVDSGQLGPNAASERAVALLSTLQFGAANSGPSASRYSTRSNSASTCPSAAPNRRYPSGPASPRAGSSSEEQYAVDVDLEVVLECRRDSYA
jgi:hypothetical protein